MSERDEPPAAIAKANWDADREKLRLEAPEWDMPAWSRAPAWRRKPYVIAAKANRLPKRSPHSKLECPYLLETGTVKWPGIT